MLIIYKSGPKAGKTAHVPRSPEIECLLNAGIIEQVQETVAPAVVKWGIHRGQNSQRPVIVGRCSRETCAMVRFDGRPEDAHQTVLIHSHAGSPPEKAPAAVLNAYVDAYAENQGLMSGDEANMIQFAHHKGDSGKRRPLFQGYDDKGKPIYQEPWW
jgi:hypothetical protein